MTKDDLLKLLTEDCRSQVRQENDITLKDFRKAFREATGLAIGDKKSRTILDKRVEAGELVSLLVIDRNGHDTRIWRKAEPKKKGK